MGHSRHGTIHPNHWLALVRGIVVHLKLGYGNGAGKNVKKVFTLVKFTKLNALNLIILLRKDLYYLSDLESLQTIKNLN